MNGDTHIFWFIRSAGWIKREIRKATELPAKEMVPRVCELLSRQEALSREVTKFLEQKDTQ